MAPCLICTDLAARRFKDPGGGLTQLGAIEDDVVASREFFKKMFMAHIDKRSHPDIPFRTGDEVRFFDNVVKFLRSEFKSHGDALFVTGERTMDSKEMMPRMRKEILRFFNNASIDEIEKVLIGMGYKKESRELKRALKKVKARKASDGYKDFNAVFEDTGFSDDYCTGFIRVLFFEGYFNAERPDGELPESTGSGESGEEEIAKKLESIGLDLVAVFLNYTSDNIQIMHLLNEVEGIKGKRMGVQTSIVEQILMDKKPYADSNDLLKRISGLEKKDLEEMLPLVKEWIKSRPDLLANLEQLEGVPKSGEEGPASIFSLKRNYAENVAPWIEEGVFTAAPFTVLSALAALGKIDFWGFLFWMGISYAIFTALHIVNFLRAPPKVKREGFLARLKWTFKAPLKVAIRNFAIVTILGGAMLLAVPTGSQLLVILPFLLLFSSSSYFFTSISHEITNMQAYLDGHAPAAAGTSSSGPEKAMSREALVALKKGILKKLQVRGLEKALTDQVLKTLIDSSGISAQKVTKLLSSVNFKRGQVQQILQVVSQFREEMKKQALDPRNPNFDFIRWSAKCYPEHEAALMSGLSEDTLTEDGLCKWIERVIKPIVPDFDLQGIASEGSTEKVKVQQLRAMGVRLASQIFIPRGVIVMHTDLAEGLSVGRIIADRTEQVTTPAGRSLPVYTLKTIKGDFGVGRADKNFAILTIEGESEARQNVKEFKKLYESYKRGTYNPSPVRVAPVSLVTLLYFHLLETKTEEEILRGLRQADLAEELSHSDTVKFVEDLWGHCIVAGRPGESAKEVMEVIQPKSALRHFFKGEKDAVKLEIFGQALLEVEGKLNALKHSPIPVYTFYEFLINLVVF